MGQTETIFDALAVLWDALDRCRSVDMRTALSLPPGFSHRLRGRDVALRSVPPRAHFYGFGKPMAERQRLAEYYQAGSALPPRN